MSKYVDYTDWALQEITKGNAKKVYNFQESMIEARDKMLKKDPDTVPLIAYVPTTDEYGTKFFIVMDFRLEENY